MKNKKLGFSNFLFGSKLAKMGEVFIQLKYKENEQTERIFSVDRKN